MNMDLQNPGNTSVSKANPPIRRWAGGSAHANETAMSGAMMTAFRAHWPEYSMEATGLGLFMISACVFGVLLFHPASPVAAALSGSVTARALMGMAMGATAIAIIFSPFGKRSGAHNNPSVTLTFLRLGKVEPWDAIFYILFQFVGGALGVTAAALFLGGLLNHKSVKYVVTVPGSAGVAPAFFAELLISFILMIVILSVSNTKRLDRWTGIFAGTLAAIFISVESPISGMSMNPARSFGSALFAQVWTSLWIYFTAPPIGMLLAAEAYLRVTAGRRVACAKLHHYNNKRCIFRCNFEA